MKTVTVTTNNGEVIAHVFEDDCGSIQAIVENEFKVIVNGQNLNKWMKIEKE